MVGWVVGVELGFFVDELFDQVRRRNDDGGFGVEFEGVDFVVLFGLFGELEVGVFGGDLMEVVDQGEGWGVGWEMWVLFVGEEEDVEDGEGEGGVVGEEEDVYC